MNRLDAIKFCDDVAYKWTPQQCAELFTQFEVNISALEAHLFTKVGGWMYNSQDSCIEICTQAITQKTIEYYYHKTLEHDTLGAKG